MTSEDLAELDFEQLVNILFSDQDQSVRDNIIRLEGEVAELDDRIDAL